MVEINILDQPDIQQKQPTHTSPRITLILVCKNSHRSYVTARQEHTQTKI